MSGARGAGGPEAGGGPLVLVVDDDAGMRKVARANLRLEGFEVATAGSAKEALAWLADHDPLAIVTDLRMPGVSGLDLLARVQELRPHVPVVLVTAHASVETAVEAMRRGALHYLTKPVRFDELGALLRHGVEAEQSRRRVLALESQLERCAGFEGLVGTSPPMRRVAELIRTVGPTDATVLLRGETGTGKELVARAIHRSSPRRERPFVSVNCTAIPRDLAESTLFGHERGAFTGAVGRQRGHFEQADGSTLFLDEVGDLELSVQGKLLRALQEREIVRLGGARPIPVDVRVVAATNRDLEAEVAAGRFREDLFYRLNVIPIELPPLRERTGDIPELLKHFLGSFAHRYGRPQPAPTPEVLQAAARYRWPGNVRELRNLCERAVLLGWESVAPLLDMVGPQAAGGTAAGETAAAFPKAWSDEWLARPFKEAKQALLDAFERQYLDRLLREHGGRMGAAARAADLAERNLYEKLRRHGIDRRDYQPRPEG